MAKVPWISRKSTKHFWNERNVHRLFNFSILYFYFKGGATPNWLWIDSRIDVFSVFRHLSSTGVQSPIKWLILNYFIHFLKQIVLWTKIKYSQFSARFPHQNSNNPICFQCQTSSHCKLSICTANIQVYVLCKICNFCNSCNFLPFQIMQLNASTWIFLCCFFLLFCGVSLRLDRKMTQIYIF